jgi:hypothetical protein
MMMARPSLWSEWLESLERLPIDDNFRDASTIPTDNAGSVGSETTQPPLAKASAVAYVMRLHQAPAGTANQSQPRLFLDHLKTTIRTSHLYFIENIPV